MKPEWEIDYRSIGIGAAAAVLFLILILTEIHRAEQRAQDAHPPLPIGRFLPTLDTNPGVIGVIDTTDGTVWMMTKTTDGEWIRLPVGVKHTSKTTKKPPKQPPIDVSDDVTATE